jgi:hypothetical protein
VARIEKRRRGCNILAALRLAVVLEVGVRELRTNYEAVGDAAPEQAAAV